MTRSTQDNPVNYLLGDDAAELRRLGIQHRVWAEETYASWRRAGFADGTTIADLGAGPGFCAMDLAQWVGAEGRVIAIDQSTHFLKVLHQQAAHHGFNNIRTLHSDLATLEMADHSIDSAYARWVFCFLADPQPIIERIAHALRPGGALVVLDYFNYGAFNLAPRSGVMEQVTAAIQRSWEQNGGSLQVQGQMPLWLEQAGLQVEEVRQVSGLARPGTPKWCWPQTFLELYIPELEKAGLLQRTEIDAFWQDWQRCTQMQGAFVYLPPLIEIRARKPQSF